MGDWVLTPKRDGACKVRLLCIPYAGAGGQIFFPWRGELRDDIQLSVVQLPGRGPRLLEDTVTDMGKIARAIGNNLPEPDNAPLIVLGHSMGAIVAWWLARELRAAELPEPDMLILAGEPAAQLPRRGEMLHEMPDDEFIQALSRYNGMSDEVLENRELLNLLLPGLRADFKTCETWVYDDEPPLSCPIMAIAGSNDDTARPDEVEAWSEQTSGRFRSVTLSGDHFFIHSAFDDIAPLIENAADELLDA